MSWEDQGRQSHGWFGHGTSSPRVNNPKDASSATSANKGDLILALGYGAVASLPAAQRLRAEAQFQGSNLARFRQAATAWLRGNRMDQAAFADRFFGRSAGDLVAQNIRDAANLAIAAVTPADMSQAAGKLADAMTDVGLDRWSRFVADAQTRAAEPATEAAIAESRRPAQASASKDLDPRGIQLAADPRRMLEINRLIGRFWGKMVPPSGEPITPTPRPTVPGEKPTSPPVSEQPPNPPSANRAVALPRPLQQIAPEELRFSQRTAGGNGRAGDQRQYVRSNGTISGPVDAVRTPDGIVTIDNTRVAVAREHGLARIPVRVWEPSDPLPADMRRRFGGSETWGEALAYRTSSQRPALPLTGTAELPRMPGGD